MIRLQVAQRKVRSLLDHYKRKVLAGTYEDGIRELIDQTLSENSKLFKRFLDVLAHDEIFTRLLDDVWSNAILGDDSQKYPGLSRIIAYLEENYPTTEISVAFPTRDTLSKVIETFAEAYK